MDRERNDDIALETLFTAGRDTRPEPSVEFLARLAADAEAAVPKPAPATAASKPFLGGLKGLFAASGLSGAAVLGLWIGFVMPDLVGDYSYSTDETLGIYTFLPGADLSALTE